MDVCGRESYRERHASSVRNKVAFRARFAAIRRVLADLLAPLLAGMLAESKDALSQSMRSAFPRRSSSTRCSSSHTPASCQSRRRRQQVLPLPQPISLGSISQGMPLLRTKMMPAKAPRSSTRGRPRKRPEKLHADKGYDFPRCRKALRRRGIKGCIARRGVESGEKLGRHRWVVERTLAWLARYRRLAVRYERRADIHEAFLHLGCSLICLNYLP